MDFDEFQESEVMFSDDYYSSDQSVETDDDHHEGVDKRLNGCNNNNKMTLKRRKSVNKKMCKKVVSSSLPIHIPNNSSSYRYDDIDEMVMSSGSFDEDLDEDRMMRLPPHLIVERRRVNKEMARSLPLKERNLYYVRNCIIRIKDYGLS